MKIGCRAMYFHGYLVDRSYAPGDAASIRSWCSHARTMGVPVGVAGHAPEAHLWVDSLNCADFHAVCFFNCGSLHDGKGEKFRLDEMAAEWGLPGFSPETHTMVVWNNAQNPVGNIELWDLAQPRVVMNCWMRVHPDYERTSIGVFLLDWAEQRARQVVPTVAEELRVVLRGGAPVKYPAMREDFRQSGFQQVRRYWTMVIELDQAPPAAQFPQGIAVRSMQPGEERLAIQAYVDSFQDHWGFVVRAFEEEYQHWKHFMDHDQEFDPNLWFFAMDGDQIAGYTAGGIADRELANVVFDPGAGQRLGADPCRPGELRKIG